jgi:hypothetical protein
MASIISSIACSSRSRCGFTFQRTALRFFVGTRTTKANPLISDHQGQAPRWLCVPSSQWIRRAGVLVPTPR